jgi:hypothetical protein
MLKIVRRQDLDPSSWDLLAQNARIFSQSWFLDEICNWQAILSEDYGSGMALPVRKRYGFKELYQPPFMQLCEWMGQPPERSELEKILKATFDHVHFNCNIKLDEHAVLRNNYFLPLNRETKQLREGYRSNHLRNAKKQDVLNLTIEQSENLDFTIAQYIKNYGNLNPQLGTEEYQLLRQLFEKLSKRGSAFHYVVLLNEQELAGLIFFEHGRRLHYIMGAQNEVGRENNAMTIAFDHIICSDKNRGKILDFEGSNISSVAHFYKGFGSSLEQFSEIKWMENRSLRLLHRIRKKLS